MHKSNIILLILLFVFGLSYALPDSDNNLQTISVIDLAPAQNGFDNPRLVELGYDDGIAGPQRDDPGSDTIFYDNDQPQTLTTGVNLWARVRFTPNTDFDLWGVYVMPLNSGPNPNAPCNIRVYREDQDNHNLTDLEWEGRIDELRAWDRQEPENNWHWIELDEDDRVEFDGSEHFSILYGPAPGGAYPGGQGSGWWTLWDGGTEVSRSYVFAGPPMDHNGWGGALGGDLFIRANGEYTGDFIDLAIIAVFNAEEEEDRRWIAFPSTEKELFAEIVNNGSEIEEFSVTFVVVDTNGDIVFECETAVEDLEANESVIVQCDEVWETPEEVGNYLVRVTVEADDDVNEENDIYGMEQIIYDQEESREMWLGFVDDNLEGNTNYQPGNGWAVRFDHPGGPVPLWITSFRAAIAAANIECPFMIHVVDFDADLDSVEWEPDWEGVVRSDNQIYVTVDLDEDDYITIHDGEGLIVTYLWVNGGVFGSDETPPIAGTNTRMPMSMMQTSGNGESFSRSQAGDYGIQIQMSGPDHGGYLLGQVFDFQDNEPIENATVTTSQDHQTETNEEGYFEFPFGPRGEFSITASKLGYNDAVLENLELEEDDTLEVELTMLHPEFEASVDEIIVETGFDGEAEENFTVSNDGNGPLTYNVERRLIEEAEIDPLTLRESIMVGAEVEDNRIEGVLLIDDLYYISGANDGDPVIYIFNREGEPVGEIEQPGEDVRGMRDLAWDGRLIWGGSGDRIYGITLDGEVIHDIESPFNPASTITWDPENGWLWVAATTRDITAIDLDGNVQAEHDRQGMRLYGLSYWVNDPDGYLLYIFYRDPDNDNLPSLSRMNPENGELEYVALLETEIGGNPGGAFITNQYDPYSWNLIAITSASNNAGGDRIDVWQIAARRDWFILDPTEGTIEAGGEQRFDLSLNAAGLVFATFEGELVFTHNALPGETVIPVTLDVIEGPVQDERTLELDMGWNMVSVNLQPEERNVVVLTQGLVDADLLLLMKDGFGHFYSPAFGFNNIPGWDVAQGYLMKMDDAAELTLEGLTVMADDPIDLIDGWQLISYYPRVPVDAIVALSGIEDRLIMAKDGYGRFYNVAWDFSNMGDLREGQGYLMKLDGEAELIYRLEEGDDELAGVVSQHQLKRNDHGKLPTHPVTGSNMSLLVFADPGLNGEIGVYAENYLIGSGVLFDGIGGIAIWGDDPTTSEVDGALLDQELELVLFDEAGQHPVQYATLDGDNRYVTDGFWVVQLEGSTVLPDKFSITSAHPNPFNSRTVVSYSLPEAARIDMELYDLNGRKALDLGSGMKPAGIHTVAFDGVNLASGVYMVQLKSQGQVSRWKVVLIR